MTNITQIFKDYRVFDVCEICMVWFLLIKNRAERKAKKAYRKWLLIYCGLLGLSMTVWLEFENMYYGFIERYYFELMMSFYLSCLILKRPLSIVSAMVDSCRIELYRSHASFNDISIEVLNEWICSIVYYSYMRIRSIASAQAKDGEVGGALPKMASLFLVMFMHLLLEAFASLIQPLPIYFVTLKRFRARTEYIWDGTASKSSDSNDVVVVAIANVNNVISRSSEIDASESKTKSTIMSKSSTIHSMSRSSMSEVVNGNNHDYQLFENDSDENEDSSSSKSRNVSFDQLKLSVSSCLEESWYAFLRLTFGWYMNNFRRDSFYNQWRNRCFIDSTMRLIIVQLTAVMTWLKAFIIYKTNYKFGNRSIRFKQKMLLLSFRYFIIQQSLELALFGMTWLWFYKRYQFRAYRPFATLTNRCKNPRYLFVLFCSWTCFMQILFGD